MSKAVPEAKDPQLTEIEETELARVIPIRTETALVRYPIHRIAKKGTVNIKQTKKNERGKVETTWQVQNPPGPLAYKLDTIIINRRIDEMRNKGEIPQLIKLGSLSDLCRELGINASGKNTNSLKDALYENVGAVIKTKLKFNSNDGAVRTFEFGTTRYTVIFTGEELPSGKKADAVYIELHPRFHEMLKHSKTRPLDYEYLKALPPSAQRLYELLSFVMFGTLKHERPIAQLFYSEFSTAAPLTRYYESKKVRSQMWKIHKPHIDSGYLKAVDFEETTDAEGQADWLIRYTPGKKAKHEFKEFTTRRDKQINAPTRPRLVEAKSNEGREEAARTAPERTPEDKALIQKLMSYGIDESRAARLVESEHAECEQWANAWPHQNQKGMDNPPAVLIRFIETKRRPFPAGYKKAQEFETRKKEIEERQARERAEETYFQFFEPAFREHQRQELESIEKEHAESFTLFKAHFDKQHGKGARMISSEKQREKFQLLKAAEFFNDTRPELGITLASFEEWDNEHNTERCDSLEWLNKDPKGIFDEIERRFKETD